MPADGIRGDIPGGLRIYGADRNTFQANRRAISMDESDEGNLFDFLDVS